MTQVKKTETAEKKTATNKKPSTATKKKTTVAKTPPLVKETEEIKAQQSSGISPYITNFRKSRAKKVVLESFGNQECLVYEVTVDFRKALSSDTVTDDKVEEIIADLVRDLDGNKIFTEEFTAFQTFGDEGVYKLVTELIEIAQKSAAKNS